MDSDSDSDYAPPSLASSDCSGDEWLSDSGADSDGEEFYYKVGSTLCADSYLFSGGDSCSNDVYCFSTQPSLEAKRKFDEVQSNFLFCYEDDFCFNNTEEEEPPVVECKAGQWDPRQLLGICELFGAVQGCGLQLLAPKLEETIKNIDKVEGHGECLSTQSWQGKGYVLISVDGSGDSGARKTVSKRMVKFKKKKLADAAATIPLLADMGADVVAERLEKVAALQDECSALEAEWEAGRSEANAGVGVFVNGQEEFSSATRIPDTHVFTDKGGNIRNTSQLAEGFAILIALLSVDRRANVVVRTDSQYWANWFLNGCAKAWILKQRDGAPEEIHHKLKAALVAAVFWKTGKIAIVKVKAHVGDTDNETADQYAKFGKLRDSGDWSLLSAIDWVKLIKTLCGCSAATVCEGKPPPASTTKKVGEMVRGECMTPAKALMLKAAVLPQLEVMFPQVKSEVEGASCAADAATAAKKWYSVYVSLLFTESAKILGTRVFGVGRGGPLQTKDFKKSESEVKELEKVIKRSKTLVDVQKADDIHSDDFDCLAKAASVIPHRPTRHVQWRVLLELASRELSRAKADVEGRRGADNKDAKIRAMLSAVNSGKTKRLKDVAFDSKSSEILLSGKLLGAHFAKSHHVPPGFNEQPFVFGPTPGFCNADADRALVLLPSVRELIRYWKGKKKSSTPGRDGVPYAVRCALIAEPGGVGAPEMDCLFYSFVYLFGFIYDEWHDVLDWPLRKGGKESYLVPNSYRNISCVDIPRKVLGRVWWARTCEWLHRCGKYGRIQVSGRRGFPGVMYASTLVKCAIRVAEFFQMSIIISFFDLNNFYPRIDIRIIAGVMLWLGIPSDVVLMFTMVHADNKAVLLVAGKICYQYDIHGIFQGCNTAIQAMIVVSLVWCFALESSGLGFRWPLSQLQLEDKIPAGFISPGVGVSDDLAAIAGGADEAGNPLHWKDVVKQAKDQSQRIFEVYEQLPVPVGQDKMVFAGLFFENGKRIYPTVSIPIFSEHGWSVKRVVPLDSAVTHLGVAQATTEGAHRAFVKRDLETETEGVALAEDSTIPFIAKWQLWSVSLLGKRKYVVDKEEQAILESRQFAKASRKIFKCAIGKPIPNAVMHAKAEDWGLGLIDTQESDLRAKVFAALALANRQEDWVYNLFLIYLNISRLVNKIRVAADGHGSPCFFDWDMTGVTRRRFVWQNEFIHFAVACAKRGFAVTRPSRCPDTRIKWCLAPSEETLQLLKVEKEIYGASKCADAFSLWADHQWATELKTLKLGGMLARNEGVDPKLSNKWKKRGKVGESTLGFHIKASCGLLSTPARLRIIGASVSAACKICGHPYADAKHALNGCNPLAGRLYQWRHQQVLQLVEAAVQKHWVVISKEQDVGVVWPTAVTIRQLTHTRPDLILMDGATEGRLLIIIIDIAVSFDQDYTMQNAYDEKMRRYEPLAAAIAATSESSVETSVQVVPIVVGSLGSIRTDWQEQLSKLRVSGKSADKLAEQASVAAIKASQWIWRMYAGVNFGHMQLHQVKPKAS